MVHSQWKYCCKIVHKWEEDFLHINHHEWFKVQVKIQMKKGKERMEEEDHRLVWMTFREFWDKGGSNKRIWIRAVHIALGEEVDDRERFSGQRWNRQRDQRRFNIIIVNPKVRRSCNRKVIRQGRRQRSKNSKRCVCSYNGQHRIGRYIGR